MCILIKLIEFDFFLSIIIIAYTKNVLKKNVFSSQVVGTLYRSDIDINECVVVYLKYACTPLYMHSTPVVILISGCLFL